MLVVVSIFVIPASVLVGGAMLLVGAAVATVFGRLPAPVVISEDAAS